MQRTNMLQKIDHIKLMDIKDCSKRLPKYHFFGGEICGGDPMNHKGTCRVENKQKRKILAFNIKY
jgi:hypothetical protein